VISQLRVSVDRGITESSEVQQLRVEWHRVHGSDYRRTTCETADSSNCQTVNCVNVRASGINSLYPIRREVTCRVTYTQHVTIYYKLRFILSHAVHMTGFSKI
jgi:hypothetical protein